MSDNNNGGSLLDSIIVVTALMFMLYIVILAIPIIPYFDMVIKLVFSVYTPESPFGKLITGVLLFSIGYAMLEFVKSLGDKIFYSSNAKYFFLYGQGLILISVLGSSERVFLISEGLIKFLSTGFKDPVDIMQSKLLIFGTLSIIVSLFLEAKARPKQLTGKKIKLKKEDVRLQNNVLIRNKLQAIKNAKELLAKDNPSKFEQTIIAKAKEYEKEFSEEELEDISKTIMKYRS